MNDESLTHLTTGRCVLHPITSEDAASLHDLWSSPGVRRFLWDDEIIPMARTLEAIERSTQSFEQRRFGRWGARPRDGVHLIGFAGPVGTVMKARFAQFFEMRNGRIHVQRNYDCFEPW